jgi:membrane protein DedA with SNARE-associated domain
MSQLLIYQRVRRCANLLWFDLGSVLGALPLYYAGRAVGEARVRDWADRHGRWVSVSRGDLERAARWFARHGGMAVLFCRLIPGVRSLISLPAGVERMPVAAFLAYTAVGAGLWTTRTKRALTL